MPSFISVAASITGTAAGTGTSGTSGTGSTGTFSAQHVGNWFEQHAALLIGHAAQIISVILACLVIRTLTHKSINRVVHHAARAAEGRAVRLLEGSVLGLTAGERTRQRAQAIGSVLRSLATAVVFGIGAMILLSLVNIPITPILASASVIGVAVGLGAQGLITDFIAGVFMIFEDQYGVGDTIDAGTAVGTVEEVGLRITKLRDSNGVMWYIRNGTITRVGNQSQGWSRAVVDVAVAYGEDLDRVRGILVETVDTLYADEAWHSRFDHDSGAPKVVGVESLDADAVVFRIQAHTAPQESAAVQRELRTRLKSAMDQAGIAIAALKGP